MALSGQGCAKCWVTGEYLIAVAFTVQRLWINWGHHFWEAKVPWPPRAQVCVRRAFIKQQLGLWEGKNNQTKTQAPVPLQFILGSLSLKAMDRSQATASNRGKKLWKDWWESALLWAPTSSAQFGRHPVLVTGVKAGSRQGAFSLSSSVPVNPMVSSRGADGRFPFPRGCEFSLLCSPRLCCASPHQGCSDARPAPWQGKGDPGDSHKPPGGTSRDPLKSRWGSQGGLVLFLPFLDNSSST